MREYEIHKQCELQFEKLDFETLIKIQNEKILIPPIFLRFRIAINGTENFGRPSYTVFP